MQRQFFTANSSPNTTTPSLDLFPNFPQATPTSWILNFHHWCLIQSLPWSCQINQMQYLSLERERFLAWEERISPLGTGKEMEKHLEDNLIASTSLETTCQTAQTACEHHGEAPKKGRDVRQNLGGILVCWGFLGVWFGFYSSCQWCTAQWLLLDP